MKKNRYIQPATDVVVVSGVNLMFNVSNGDIPDDEGPAHAPARGSLILIN